VYTRQVKLGSLQKDGSKVPFLGGEKEPIIRIANKVLVAIKNNHNPMAVLGFDRRF